VQTRYVWIAKTRHSVTQTKHTRQDTNKTDRWASKAVSDKKCIYICTHAHTLTYVERENSFTWQTWQPLKCVHPYMQSFTHTSNPFSTPTRCLMCTRFIFAVYQILPYTHAADTRTMCVSAPRAAAKHGANARVEKIHWRTMHDALLVAWGHTFNSCWVWKYLQPLALQFVLHLLWHEDPLVTAVARPSTIALWACAVVR